MAGTAIEDAAKANLYTMLGQGATKAKIARDLGLTWNTVDKYVRQAREAIPSCDAPEVHPIESPHGLSRQVIEEMTSAVLTRLIQQMPGAFDLTAGKPDVVEQAPVQFPVHPQTRSVDLGFKKYERIAFISDLHCPFQDKAAVTVTCKAIRDYKPNAVVLAGDFYDFYSVSEHDKEPGRCKFLQAELDAAKPTVQEVDDAAGDADVLFLEGNHEYRLARMLQKNEGLCEMRSLQLPVAAELPRRWQYFPNQTRFKLGPLTLLHGDVRGRGTSVKHAGFGMLSKLRTSCMFGHLHRFQTYHETADDGTIRGGFANGHLCDVSEAKYITSPDWQMGWTSIDFDWSIGVFSVAPHLIVKNAMRWGNITYHA